MAMFKTRSRGRDQEADRQRFRRLTTLLQAIIDEMTTEGDGLEARQRKTKDDAAFSLLAFEDDGGQRMSAKVDELTASIVAATNRLKLLREQIAFMRRLLNEAIAFGERPASEPPDKAESQLSQTG